MLVEERVKRRGVGKTNLGKSAKCEREFIHTMVGGQKSYAHIAAVADVTSRRNGDDYTALAID